MQSHGGAIIIIKVAGTSGSGKTTLARGFMSLWKFHPIIEDGRITHYKAPIDVRQPLHGTFKQVVVLGRYTTVCGGMDTVTDAATRLAMVELWCGKRAKDTLVLFEGLFTGNTYGAMGDLSEHSAVPWVYAFMDTPFDVCVQRVLARRQARGDDRPFDPAKGGKGIELVYRKCLSVARRAAEHGHPVHMVDHTQSGVQQAKAVCKFVGKL